MYVGGTLGTGNYAGRGAIAARPDRDGDIAGKLAGGGGVIRRSQDLGFRVAVGAHSPLTGALTATHSSLTGALTCHSLGCDRGTHLPLTRRSQGTHLPLTWLPRGTHSALTRDSPGDHQTWMHQYGQRTNQWRSRATHPPYSFTEQRFVDVVRVNGKSRPKLWTNSPGEFTKQRCINTVCVHTVRSDQGPVK
jgi:hypothetical protein